MLLRPCCIVARPDVFNEIIITTDDGSQIFELRDHRKIHSVDGSSAIHLLTTFHIFVFPILEPQSITTWAVFPAQRQGLDFLTGPTSKKACQRKAVTRMRRLKVDTDGIHTKNEKQRRQGRPLMDTDIYTERYRLSGWAADNVAVILVERFGQADLSLRDTSLP